MDDGPMGPAMAIALMIGTAATFALCVRLLTWALSALICAVHMTIA